MSVFLIILLSSFLIYGKGSAYGSKESFFSHILKYYIEERAIPGLQPSQAYLADINSIFTEDELFKKSDKHIEKPLVQGNSLLSYNSIENKMDGFANSSENNKNVSIYIVQEGDVLSFIASDFGVSVSSIMWANNIQNPNNIKPGMELKIPPITGIIHSVKQGDTIGSIAKKYSAKTEEIIDFNDLPRDGSIRAGMEIVVPGGKIAAPTVAIAPTTRNFGYLPDLGDYFIRPAGGRITQWIHGRNAIDIANSCWTPIYAAAEGVTTAVANSGYNGGYGLYIKINHPNGTATLYAHNIRNLVALGQHVTRGQLIAYMGSTGRSTGCHLHFETHGARNPLAR